MDSAVATRKTSTIAPISFVAFEGPIAAVGLVQAILTERSGTPRSTGAHCQGCDS